MKTSKFISLSVIIILLFGSCTVTHVNENLLIGKWKNGKIKSFIVNKKFSEDTIFNASNKLRLGIDSANLEANEKNSLREFKVGLTALGPVKPGGFNANMRNEMNFRADKTVTISLRNGVINGTWKMNGKGNKVTVRDTVTNKKQTINIALINLSNLIIYEKYPVGNLMFIYSK